MHVFVFVLSIARSFYFTPIGEYHTIFDISGKKDDPTKIEQ